MMFQAKIYFENFKCLLPKNFLIVDRATERHIFCFLFNLIQQNNNKKREEQLEARLVKPSVKLKCCNNISSYSF